MLGALKRNARAASGALAVMRQKGYGTGAALAALPHIAMTRGYHRAARTLNANPLFTSLDRHAIRTVVASPGAGGTGPFYVIVMPGTLQFLLPCLWRVPRATQLVLLGNGAAAWELALLRARLPGAQVRRLRTLPGSSLAHGDVLTLLLRECGGDFGVLDHDFYVFDPALFDDLAPGTNEAVVAAVGSTSDTGVDYPETYFLYFNAGAMRGLMARYGVEARIYHRLPARAQAALAQAGLSTLRLKRYHRYYDTLHVLFLLALAEGLTFRFSRVANSESVAHIGGTSASARHTRSLVSSFAAWRFLELVDDPDLSRRYQARLRPFSSSAEVRARIPLTPDNFARVEQIEALAARLRTEPRPD